MSLLDAFEPNRKRTAPRPKFVQRRQVPLQPGDVPPDKVYLGVEVGLVSFTGERPKPGEVVTVLFDRGDAVAFAVAAQPERNPIFAGGECRCRCPPESTGGLLFYLNPVAWTTNLIVVHGGSGDLVYRSDLPEVLSGVGVAVDPDPPHTLYILDDRFSFTNLITDATPNALEADKNYYAVVEYTLTGGSYVFERVTVLSGGYTGAVGSGTPTQPPNTATNCLSVVDGQLYIARTGTPLGFFRGAAGVFAELTLTQNEIPVAGGGLVGQVVQVEDRPARRSSLYVATVDHRILRFTTEGVVEEAFTVPDLVNPKGLVTVCNRLFVYESAATGRQESESDPTTGGGGGGGGGEES